MEMAMLQQSSLLLMMTGKNLKMCKCVYVHVVHCILSVWLTWLIQVDSCTSTPAVCKKMSVD